MACSVCRRLGHKKPNCPVVKEENQKQIDRAITLLQTIPILINHPLVIAGIWYQLSQMVPSINALNNLIATAEIVPTVDLNIPPGVVLGAMIDKTEDSIELFNDVKDFIFDFEIPEIPTKEEVTSYIIPDWIEDSAFLEAYNDCKANAKKTLGYSYWLPGVGATWINSCLLQKGFDVPIQWIKGKLF